MQALLMVHVHIQNLSNQVVDYVKDKGCFQGQKLQERMMNSSPDVKYFLEILSWLPLLLAIHFWFLLGPYSEISILWLFWYIVKITVAHRMTRALMFNTKTLFSYYILIYLELFIATLEDKYYWTVDTWDDSTVDWWTPGIGMILIESIYFWIHVNYTWTLKTFCHIVVRYFIFIVFILPFVLPVIGILPSKLPFVCYFMSKIRLAVTLFTKTMTLEMIDMRFDSLSLCREKNKGPSKDYGDFSKSMQKFCYFHSRVHMNRNREHLLNYSKNGVRDVFFMFGFLYFGTALILEVALYDTSSLSDSVFLNPVCIFLLRWSASFLPVLTISFCFCFIDKIITGLPVWLVSWEKPFMNAVNIGIDSRASHFIFFTLLLETGIPTANTNVDVKAVIIVAVLLYCFHVQNAVLNVGKSMVDVYNVSLVQGTWFYLRVFIAFLMLLIVPAAMFVFVIDEETWLVFFASGGIVFISNIVFIVIECALISLSWNLDTPALEQCIQYVPDVQHCSCILLLPIQFYARFMISVFQAWWILRAGYLILIYIMLSVIPAVQRKRVHDKEITMSSLLDNLHDVSYSSLTETGRDTCSICFTLIRNGKQLPCNHVFHAQCLHRWFKVREFCPLCNAAVRK